MPRRRFFLRKLSGPLFVVALALALFPHPVAGQGDDAVKAAVLRGIGLYLGQLDGACFAQDINIGELSAFQTAINKNLNRFIIGAEGAAWLKANSNNAESSHYAWRGIGMTADIIFPFDPRSPKLEMKNRQTMMHEMTHHIEWLQGVKEASRSVMGTPNPNSERNTEYQDKVIDALVAWKKFEDRIKQDPNALNVEAWKNLENSLRDVTAGAAAGGHRHDDNLQSMTGIDVSFDTIRAKYLDGTCGKQFRALVLIAESTGRLDWTLQFEGPNSATVGETVTLTAGVYNREAKTDADYKVELKPELGATFRWRIPGVSAVIGNPIKFAPAEATKDPIPVELTVRHDGQDYVIAQGNYDIIVDPKKVATEPPPEKPPVEKPPAPKPPTERPAPPPTPPAGVATPPTGEPQAAAGPGAWTLQSVTDAKEITADGSRDFGHVISISGSSISMGCKTRWLEPGQAISSTSTNLRYYVEEAGTTARATDAPATITPGQAVSLPWHLETTGKTTQGCFLGTAFIKVFGRNDAFSILGGTDPAIQTGSLFEGEAKPGETRDLKIELVGAGGSMTRTYRYAYLAGPVPPAGPTPPAVTISADKPAPTLGDTVTLRASVTGGTPPYQYTWTGPATGRAAALPFPVSKPGRYDFIVTVVDAKGATASAAASIEAKALAVAIRLAGGSSRVPIGQTLSFAATVSSPDGSAPPPGLIYRWSPHPEVEFTPFEGSGNTSTARFPKIGTVKVWVDLLQKNGAVLSTVAESEQLEIEVVPPALALRVTPERPYPGQEVRITASETPAVGDAFLTYWWEYTGNAINPGGGADSRVYTFRPKDLTSVKVTAHAKAIDGGDDLGEKAIVVTARAHDIRVSEPRARGPKPTVWDPKRGGLVEVDTGFAVFQDISLRADVAPAPENVPVRYEWTVAPDGCSISNPISQEPTFNCSQTGSFTAMVTVRDSLGATLGSGRGPLSITISQSAMQGGKDQADAARQAAADAARLQQEELAKRETAQRLRADGAALQKAGKLREAAAKYRESLAYVPDPAMEAYIAQVEAAAVKQEQAAQQAAAAAEQQQREQQARQATAQRLRKEGIALQEQGKYREAAARYRESLPYYPDPELEKIIGQLEAEAARRDQAAEQARRAEEARRTEEERRAEEKPAPEAGCRIDGTYEGGNADGRLSLTLRQSGEQLQATLALTPEGDETARVNMEGSIKASSIRLSVTVESDELTISGTASDNCQTLRVTATVGGDSQSFTLTRK